MRTAAVVLACLAATAQADDREVQRALLQRDQLRQPLPLPGRPASNLDPIPLKGFGG